MTPTLTAPPRGKIYYWKCDRPAAFHGTDECCRSELGANLRRALGAHFSEHDFPLTPAGGQGNHATFRAQLAETEVFVRVEDGPERDDYLEVESQVLGEVCRLGLPAPRVVAVDASRQQVPFAWQVLEYIPHSDLNELRKRHALDLRAVAHDIGAAVGRWQALRPDGFGPFDASRLRKEERLTGYHAAYADYFQLHLDRHLHFLVAREFLSKDDAAGIASEIENHRDLLALEQGCLVHKDLALWNILGTATQIAAFIDWDDAISGDSMDDLSLLACFHGSDVIARAMEGYTSVLALPPEHRRRFWLHLLRNMIVKAVIRVGAGYFERGDGFFLIGAGGSGVELKAFTQARWRRALLGLREDHDITTL